MSEGYFALQGTGSDTLSQYHGATRLIHWIPGEDVDSQIAAMELDQLDQGARVFLGPLAPPSLVRSLEQAENGTRWQLIHLRPWPETYQEGGEELVAFIKALAQNPDQVMSNEGKERYGALVANGLSGIYVYVDGTDPLALDLGQQLQALWDQSGSFSIEVDVHPVTPGRVVEARVAARRAQDRALVVLLTRRNLAQVLNELNPWDGFLILMDVHPQGIPGYDVLASVVPSYKSFLRALDEVDDGEKLAQTSLVTHQKLTIFRDY